MAIRVDKAMGKFLSTHDIPKDVVVYIDTRSCYLTADVSGTLTTRTNKSGHIYITEPRPGNYPRIRKFTPKECFILMDVSNKDIAKIQQYGAFRGGIYPTSSNIKWPATV